MGTTLNSVERLTAPFASVDEQVFVMPTGTCNEIANSAFKIIFLLEGACQLEIDDTPKVRIDAGDIIVIPCACRQRYWPLGPRDSHRLHAIRLVLDLPLAVGQRPAAPHSDLEQDFAAYLRHHLHEVRHLPQGQDAVVRLLLTELRQEAEERRTGHRFRVSALCSMVAIEIVRRLSEHEAPAPPQRRGRARLVLHTREYLQKNLSRQLNLGEVAGHLHVSAEHLARVFKQQTGQTVFTCLQQMRLEKAKTHLIGTDRTITAIARLTGFSSVALFSRTFKRATGNSPLQYRQERWNRAAEKM